MQQDIFLNWRFKCNMPHDFFHSSSAVIELERPRDDTKQHSGVCCQILAIMLCCISSWRQRIQQLRPKSVRHKLPIAHCILVQSLQGFGVARWIFFCQPQNRTRHADFVTRQTALLKKIKPVQEHQKLQVLYHPLEMNSRRRDENVWKCCQPMLTVLFKGI